MGLLGCLGMDGCNAALLDPCMHGACAAANGKVHAGSGTIHSSPAGCASCCAEGNQVFVWRACFLLLGASRLLYICTAH